MMKSACCWVVLLVALWGGVSSDEAQCNDRSPVTEKRDFPDIFDMASGIFYQTDVEVTYTNLKQTIYVTEYYNIMDRSGRVDIKDSDKVESFLYFSETNETFTYNINDMKCDTGKLKDIPPFEKDMVWNWKDYEKSTALFGPSAILRQAYLNQKSVVFMGEGEIVRGMPTLKWRQCDLNKAITVDYYFLATSWEEPYNTKNTVPLRVQVSGTAPELSDATPQTYEFFAFKPYISDMDALQIPPGLGCKRLVKTGEVPPAFNDTDLDFYGEAVIASYDKVTGSLDEYWKYITNFRITYDKRSRLVTYQYTPWRNTTRSPTDKKEVRGVTFEIHDLHHKFIYKYGDEKCTIDRDETNGPKIAFPTGEESIALFDTNVLLGNDNFQYLGVSTVRDYPVYVFEKTFGDEVEVPVEKVGAVFTRYYLRGDTFYADGTNTKNAPVQINLMYRGADKKPIHLVMLNLHGFTTYVHDKPRKFDVTPCFPDGGVRFVLTYSAQPEEIMRAMAVVPEIVTEVAGSLYLKGVSPNRIHDILVDFDNTHIYVSAILLERPDYAHDFEVKNGAKLSTEGKVQEGIGNENDCARECIEAFSECTGYSMCKKECILTSEQNPEPLPEGDCVSGKKRDEGEYPPIQPVHSLKRSIKALVQQRQLVLAIEDPLKPDAEPLYVKATSVDFMDESN